MLLKNGVICDYSQERKADVRIEEGKIAQIGENLAPKPSERVIECAHKVIMPAMIDIAYPKNKSLSRKNLESLTQKALKGGIGSVLLHADTTPRIDTESIIELILSLDSALRVHFLPSLAPYKDGRMCEIASLVSSGARAICLESANGAQGYALYKIAQYAQMLEIPIFASAQDSSLSEGAINEGAVSTRLGLPGIPAIAQSMEVARLCEMARFSKTKWVLDAISEVESLQIIEFFKNAGAQILAQTPIHHLILSDEDCAGFDTRFKLFPPLKDSDTRAFLRDALTSQIDMLTCLQSDSFNSQKDQVFESASFGIDAFEIYFALGVEYLVKPGIISLSRFSELTAKNQARTLNLAKGGIECGSDADVIIADLDSSICVQDTFSPYHGRKLAGKVEQVIIGGEMRFGE